MKYVQNVRYTTYHSEGLKPSGAKKSIVAMLVFLVAFLRGTTLLATDTPLIQFQNLSLTYQKYAEGSRDPLVNQGTLPGRFMNFSFDLNFQVSLLHVVYFDSIINSFANESQFSLVGWHYFVGLHVIPTLDVYYEHWSQHALDSSFSQGYPVQDSVGFKWWLYKSDEKQRSLF